MSDEALLECSPHLSIAGNVEPVLAVAWPHVCSCGVIVIVGNISIIIAIVVAVEFLCWLVVGCLCV